MRARVRRFLWPWFYRQRWFWHPDASRALQERFDQGIGSLPRGTFHLSQTLVMRTGLFVRGDDTVLVKR